MSRRLLAVTVALVTALIAQVTPAAAQTVPAPTTWPGIDPVVPWELGRLTPLLVHGAVIMSRRVDGGATSRATIFVRIHAPLETVYRVVSSPEDYPAFIPAISNVEIRSRRGRRSAFRFHANAAVFEMTTDATMHGVSDRRIDFTIPMSDFGPSGSRWEFFPESPTETVAALTVWTDPGQGIWLVRQMAGSSGYAASSGNFTIETVLALSVKRRAESLAGAHQAIRPEHPYLPATTLSPPPAGPWLELAHRAHMIILGLDDTGALTQITSVGTTHAAPAAIAHRLLDVEHWGQVWGWMRNTSAITHTADSVRFRLTLEAPLASGQGEFVGTVEPGGMGVHLDGVSGDFAGEHHRWDFVTFDNGTFALYTGGSEALHAPWLHRQLMNRDPFAMMGMSAYWKVIMLRFGLNGL